MNPELSGSFARLYLSAAGIKDQLRNWNPHCNPRTRSAYGKHVRFTCKNEGKGCALNVSCIKDDAGCLKMSSTTYRRGTCADAAPSLECCTCGLSLDSSQSVCCDNERDSHTLCRGCFSNMVKGQVTGVGKATFMRSQVVNCTLCKPVTALSMRNAAQHLKQDVWTSYLTAVTEAAVVAEQERFAGILQQQMQQVSAPPSPFETAMANLRSVILPKCPACSKVITDFEACASIVCGRVSMPPGSSQSVLGCGALLCGWCMRVCTQHDHSAHVRDCVHNPRRGNIWPDQKEWFDVQSNLSRQRVYGFVATLPRGVSSEVLHAAAEEFPKLNLKVASLSTTAEECIDTTSKPHLRPHPQPRVPTFLENVDQLVALKIATRSRAEQVLEGCGNDLQAAVHLLL